MTARDVADVLLAHEEHAVLLVAGLRIPLRVTQCATSGERASLQRIEISAISMGPPKPSALRCTFCGDPPTGSPGPGIVTDDLSACICYNCVAKYARFLRVTL